MSPGSTYADVCRIRTRTEMKFWPGLSLVREVAGHLAKKRPFDRPDGSWMAKLLRNIGIRPIIFSVNCYIATILALFIAFSLDLKTPAWSMLTVYLTSQPLSGALRAKAVYRVIGTFIGGAAMIAIVPNLVDAPELTTLAIILWVALCAYLSLLDRTPRACRGFGAASDATGRNGTAPDRRRYQRTLCDWYELTIRHLVASPGYRHHSRLRSQDRG